MRNRLVGAVTAAAIAAAALVACTPPNENPSDVKVTDQENPTHTFDEGGDEAPATTTSKDTEATDATSSEGAETTATMPAEDAGDTGTGDADAEQEPAAR